MAYVIEKKIPVAMQERIFRETKKIRCLTDCYWLNDDDFIIDIQNTYLPCAIDYESGNYLMRLRSEGDCEPVRSRYLFYYNNNCYLFYTDMIGSNELIFFSRTKPPKEKTELFQTELENAFRAVGRNLSGWTNNPLTQIFPIISTVLTEEW